jgi:peptidoglycan hydrolase-like protein with peptidoglycan-binding domain
LAVVLQQSQASNQASAVPARNPTADLVQDSAKQAVPSPKQTIGVQNRLIELGYLAGTADGAWGPRSRTALRAFKVANGLAADDTWDKLASEQLFSAAAARAPAPTAGR